MDTPDWTDQDEALLKSMFERRIAALQLLSDKVEAVVANFHYRDMSTSELTKGLIDHATSVCKALKPFDKGEAQ